MVQLDMRSDEKIIADANRLVALAVPKSFGEFEFTEDDLDLISADTTFDEEFDDIPETQNN